MADKVRMGLDTSDAVLEQVVEDPIGYTPPSMDQEMNFPNPVVRTDLPTRKRRWPKLVTGGLVLLVCGVVFFPQILSSRVGRKFVVDYISARVNSPVTIESFKTSWFGGTSIKFLSIKDPMGRRMGCNSLTCQASLWNLLRGKYKLGDTTIDGLTIDYVVDDGRGSDSFDRMRPPVASEDGAGSPAPSRALPNLSGNIKINSGVVVFHRGTVQPKLFEVTWNRAPAKFSNIRATFNIESLDKPWTYTFIADNFEEGDETGEITSNGTVDLGENGLFDPSKLALDLKLNGKNMRLGALGEALIAGESIADIRQAMGLVLKEIDISVKAANGKLTFEKLEMAGQTAALKSAKATIDLAATPAVLTVDQPTTISVGISKRLAGDVLVYIHPFLREAAGGHGNVQVELEQLTLPLAKNWKTLTAKGTLKVNGAELTRFDEMGVSEPLPKNLASSLALIDNDSDSMVPFTTSGNFMAADGNLSPVMQTQVRDDRFVLDGQTELDSGNLKMNLRFTNHAGLVLPLGGTVRAPVLGVLSPVNPLAEADMKALSEQVNTQITRMRARETQRLLQKSQQQVQDLLRPLQGATTQPTTSLTPANPINK